MDGFSPLRESELQRLADDELIAYLRAASRAGNAHAARQAIAILAYGRMDDVRRRMRLRVPSEAVEDLASEALVRAIASAFDGSSQGEFHVWLGVIIERTAIDYYRRRERRPTEAPLPTEHVGEDAVWGQEPRTGDDTGLVAFMELVERALGELNPTHRRVIELHVFEDLDAKATAARVDDGMRADNVAQIASRFRKRLRELLDTGT